MTAIRELEARVAELVAKVKALESDKAALEERVRHGFEEIMDKVHDAMDANVNDLVVALYQELQDELGIDFKVTAIEAALRRQRTKRHRELKEKGEKQLNGSNGVAKAAPQQKGKAKVKHS